MCRNQNKFFKWAQLVWPRPGSSPAPPMMKGTCHRLIFSVSGQSSSWSGWIPVSYTVISIADMSRGRKISGLHHPLIYFSFLKTFFPYATAQRQSKESATEVDWFLQFRDNNCGDTPTVAINNSYFISISLKRNLGIHPNSLWRY